MVQPFQAGWHFASGLSKRLLIQDKGLRLRLELKGLRSRLKLKGLRLRFELKGLRLRLELKGLRLIRIKGARVETRIEIKGRGLMHL